MDAVYMTADTRMTYPVKVPRYCNICGGKMTVIGMRFVGRFNGKSGKEVANPQTTVLCGDCVRSLARLFNPMIKRWERYRAAHGLSNH